VQLCVFEARPGRSLFRADASKCHCCIDALLEPPRRPVSITVPASATSAAGQQRAEHKVAKTNGTLVAGSLIHGIASRLRARSATGIKYKVSDDDDDTDVADNCEAVTASDTENDVAHLDDDEDDFEDQDGDETSSVNRRTTVADDKYCRASGLSAPSHKTKESLAVVGMANVEMYDDAVGGESSSSDSDAADTDWSPKKPLHRNPVKRTKAPACLRFKLKTDPALDDELNAIRNSDTGGACESKSTTGNRRAHKTSLSAKSLTRKLKHMSHKKSHLQTDTKNRVRSVRSKDGPKWEKKASLFTEYQLLNYW